MSDKLLSLIDFDSEFYESRVSKEDRRKINMVYRGSTIYVHTILYNDIKIGFVSYDPLKTNKRIGFVQILIIPKYRGLGFAAKAEDLLAKKYNVTELWATILKTNETSIKMHTKAGFKMFSEEKMNQWRKAGKMGDDVIRMYKKY